MGGTDDDRDPKVWRTASGGSVVGASVGGGGGSAEEAGTIEVFPAPLVVPSPCPSPVSQHADEEGFGGCSACEAAFVSRKSVRWHPLVTLPQCLDCFARANSTLTLVLVQHHHQQRRRRQQQQQQQPGLGEGSDASGANSTRKRARSPASASIDGLVCLVCLQILPEAAADAVIRCGRGKHPLCPATSSGGQQQPQTASRLVVCHACLDAHGGPERAALWRAQHASGAWACFICDKRPLLELALEKGWGLPSYPQDLRMSAEVQE